MYIEQAVNEYLYTTQGPHRFPAWIDLSRLSKQLSAVLSTITPILGGIM